LKRSNLKRSNLKRRTLKRRNLKRRTGGTASRVKAAYKSAAAGLATVASANPFHGFNCAKYWAATSKLYPNIYKVEATEGIASTTTTYTITWEDDQLIYWGYDGEHDAYGGKLESGISTDQIGGKIVGITWPHINDIYEKLIKEETMDNVQTWQRRTNIATGERGNRAESVYKIANWSKRHARVSPNQESCRERFSMVQEFASQIPKMITKPNLTDKDIPWIFKEFVKKGYCPIAKSAETVDQCIRHIESDAAFTGAKTERGPCERNHHLFGCMFWGPAGVQEDSKELFKRGAYGWGQNPTKYKPRHALAKKSPKSKAF